MEDHFYRMVRKTRCNALIFLLFGAISAILVTNARADSFGSGGNVFSISFVSIGNPGNGDDVDNPYNAPGDGGTASGGVPYIYRIGITEVAKDWIDKATASGLANVAALPLSANKPAVRMSWFEAAAFVNWLNTSTGRQAAYNLTWSGTGWTMAEWSAAEAWQLGGQNRNRHKDAFYFLPNDDEWYKAAYHKNDGATSNYWDYPTGSNTIPTAVASGTGPGTAVYNQFVGPPTLADVGQAGGLSPYGTRGQGGNVWEWVETESLALPGGDRILRGGSSIHPEDYLRSSLRGSQPPSIDVAGNIGFRVASLDLPADSIIVSSTGSNVEYRFRTMEGFTYSIEASDNLATWGPIESGIVGTGGIHFRTYSTTGRQMRFFRLVRN